MENNPDTQNERDLVARKGGASSSATMTRGTGEKVREGWENFKAKLTGKWSKLDANELDTYQSRSRNDLVGYIGQRTGTDRSLVERDIDTFARDTNYRWE